ncbi:YgfX family protein [Halomonas sp. 328]|uniref:hypothetical protein n=1 Tax=Halomonas sp. 328 TaxID=2776704 RepID=UPI0018A75475|nr:hypothetical protein [Halomonas sp. 328]MBF8221752.1 hypothetical protein [Halomonas sp. 328]
MPNTAIAISFAPSRWALLPPLLSGGGTLVLLALHAPPGMTALAALSLGAGLYWQARRRPGGRLRFVPIGEGGEWEWAESQGDWRRIELSCDYLGPWLIGLRLGRRRFWVWPDSAGSDARRRLRRHLVARRAVP